MANDTNVCVFTGRVANSNEMKYTNSGVALFKFSLAVNRKYDKTESVSFLQMTMWGKQAEALAQYFTKGKQVSVVCEAVQNRWETESGDSRSVIEFHVKSVTFVGGGSKSDGKATESYESPGPENFDDDIPF